MQGSFGQDSLEKAVDCPKAGVFGQDWMKNAFDYQKGRRLRTEHTGKSF